MTGRLWGAVGAVGWGSAGSVAITLDLGGPANIAAVSFKTAAGDGGVRWPKGILLFASTDGIEFTALGDLVSSSQEQGRAPAQSGYAEHTFRTQQLDADARFLRIMVIAEGSYIFCDEITVLGTRISAARALQHPIIDTQRFGRDWSAARTLRLFMASEITRAQDAISASRLPERSREPLSRRIVSLRSAIEAMSTQDWLRTNGQLPLNDYHAALYQIHGELAAARDETALQAWAAHPYAFITPLETSRLAADAAAQRVEITAMQGETRHGAVNLRNASSQPMMISVRVALDPNLAAVDVSKVVWTLTSAGLPIASRLDGLTTTPKDGAQILLPAGMTMQLWLALTPKERTAGMHSGTLELTAASGARATVPLQLHVLARSFPAVRSIALSGWDYTDSTYADAHAYAVTEGNVESLINKLHAGHLFIPWATSAVLPFGQPDAAGHWQQPTDTRRLDTWIARWPAAPRWRVFLAADESIGALRAGTPKFEAFVQQWTHYWAKHLRRRGIDPAKVDLLLVDEPRNEAQIRLTIAWARPIRASASGFKIWSNPTYPAPQQIPAALLRITDTLCINRTIALAAGEKYWDWIAAQTRRGKQVELYDTGGPAHAMDPYTYYRLQAWRAYAMNARVSLFWSFTDTGGEFSDREFAAPRVAYTPLFVDRQAVSDSKHMAAIIEGLQDAEYLVMLDQEIARSNNPRTAAAARSLLQHAISEVNEQELHTNFHWHTANRDASRADRLRLTIAAAIVSLQAPRP